MEKPALATSAQFIRDVINKMTDLVYAIHVNDI